MSLVPAKLSFLLHCHSIAEPHPNVDAPVIQEAVREFLEAGVIESKPSNPVNTWQTTEKGRVWVEHICDTPMPEQKWVRRGTESVKGLTYYINR